MQVVQQGENPNRAVSVNVYMGMVHFLSMVWRRLLRKRWVLGIVFGLSLIYFLTSTFKQEERTVHDRNLLQVQEHEPIMWKVQFSLGNSSQLSNQCRNSVQGKLFITDELGYVCERKDVLVNGCCNVNVPSAKLYSCESCLPNGCCSVYEYCVSCCLQPNKVCGAPLCLSCSDGRPRVYAHATSAGAFPEQGSYRFPEPLHGCGRSL
ncbi:SREBP regulating gene protein isoform X2 [Eretmochelys imbricata]